MLPELSDFTLTICHAGREKTVLTPPPVAPPPFWVLRPGDSHHVTSLLADANFVNIVPPTPSEFGLELGKSIWARPSSIWSPEPSSPETQVVVAQQPCRAQSVIDGRDRIRRPTGVILSQSPTARERNRPRLDYLVEEVDPPALIKGGEIDRDIGLGT
jgi:hypothetical protein